MVLGLKQRRACHYGETREVERTEPSETFREMSWRPCHRLFQLSSTLPIAEQRFLLADPVYRSLVDNARLPSAEIHEPLDALSHAPGNRIDHAGAKCP